MTTAIAWRRDGVSHLAADRKGTNFDGQTFELVVSKVIQVTDWLTVAMAGGAKSMRWVRSAKPPKDTPTDAASAAAIAEAWLSEIFRKHKNYQPENPHHADSVAVLATPWWVAAADPEGTLLPVADGALAVGSGGAFALGAYEAGLGIDGVFMVAARLDNHTSARYDVVHHAPPEAP